MTWASDCELLAGDSNDAFGQEVQYEDSQTTPAVTLTCPVTRERRERRQSQNLGMILVRVRKVFVDNSEQAVRYDGVFTIGGLRYSIESMEKVEASGRTIVNVQRVAAEELTRPGYRG